MHSRITIHDQMAAVRRSFFEWCRANNWVRGLLLACAFAALTGLLAQIRIYLPFTPVPITGQTLGVLLAGSLLGARHGAWSMGAYLALGLVGVPWFAGGTSGPAYIMSPTMGYLIGFIAAAWLIGRLSDNPRLRRPIPQLVTMCLGMLVVYALGAAWLIVISPIGIFGAIAVGVLPFLIGDALKILLATSISTLILPGAKAAW